MKQPSSFFKVMGLVVAGALFWSSALSSLAESPLRISQEESALSSAAAEGYSAITTYHAPVADSQSIYTDQDWTVTVALTGYDADGCENEQYTIQILDATGSGQMAVVNGQAACVDGFLLQNITYTPNINFIGRDSLRFAFADDTSASNQAEISIVVLAL